MKAYDQDNPDKHYGASNGGDLSLPDKSNQESLLKLVRTLYFIASWLFSFETSHKNQKTTYQEKLKVVFEKCQWF